MPEDYCGDCFAGVTHDGTPTGKIENIGGIDCYVATPEGDYAKEKAVLFLVDVFGMQLVNNQLLTDDFAKNGYKTYCIDYLYGDPVPEDAMSGGTWDRAAWGAKHPMDSVREATDKVIAVLKEQGVTDFGATGYCLGGRVVFDLAFDHAIKVGATSHPSRLAYPADFEKYVSTTEIPLLINSCEEDTQFPKEIHACVDAIFASYAPGYKREYYEGCKHGFAVRGDMTNPKIKAGKEGAFESSVKWFKKYL